MLLSKIRKQQRADDVRTLNYANRLSACGRYISQFNIEVSPQDEQPLLVAAGVLSGDGKFIQLRVQGGVASTTYDVDIFAHVLPDRYTMQDKITYIVDE